jgi:uncharacterized membrane protein YeiH
MKYNGDTLVFTADLLGTLVFAVEGATIAIRSDLDLLGILVLAFVTALGGGIVRDLLIGAAPHASIHDWRYGVTAFLGGAGVFLFHQFLEALSPHVLLVLDAAGLALFAVAGAGKALSYSINPFVAVLMGGITGVGGGTIRDILLARVPTVLRSDIYATAALAGAAVFILGLRLRGPRTAMASLGGTVCFLLRMVSVWQHWNLPTAH